MLWDVKTATFTISDGVAVTGIREGAEAGSGLSESGSVCRVVIWLPSSSSIFPGGHVHKLHGDCCGIGDCGGIDGIAIQSVFFPLVMVTVAYISALILVVVRL